MSLSRTPPKRLKETHKGLEQLSNRSFSKERLDANQALIEKGIQAIPSGTNILSWTKLMGLSTLTAITAAAIWFTTTQPDITPAPQKQDVSVNKYLAPEQTQQNTDQPTTVKEKQGLTLQKEIVNTEANNKPEKPQKPADEDGKFKSIEKAPLRIQPSTTRQPKSKAPKPDLGAEIKSFQKAKAHFANKEYKQAQAVLAELRDNFDNPKLKVEVTLLTVQTLLATQQADNALSILQSLMQKSQVQPQAQWYKLLGDIQKSRVQCGQALIAYSKALKIGLSEEQQNQVSVSVRACSSTQ